MNYNNATNCLATNCQATNCPRDELSATNCPATNCLATNCQATNCPRDELSATNCPATNCPSAVQKTERGMPAVVQKLKDISFMFFHVKDVSQQKGVFHGMRQGRQNEKKVDK